MSPPLEMAKAPVPFDGPLLSPPEMVARMDRLLEECMAERKELPRLRSLSSDLDLGETMSEAKQGETMSEAKQEEPMDTERGESRSKCETSSLASAGSERDSGEKSASPKPGIEPTPVTPARTTVRVSTTGCAAKTKPSAASSERRRRRPGRPRSAPLGGGSGPRPKPEEEITVAVMLPEGWMPPTLEEILAMHPSLLPAGIWQLACSCSSSSPGVECGLHFRPPMPAGGPVTARYHVTQRVPVVRPTSQDSRASEATKEQEEEEKKKKEDTE